MWTMVVSKYNKNLIQIFEFVQKPNIDAMLKAGCGRVLSFYHMKHMCQHNEFCSKHGSMSITLREDVDNAI